MDCVNHDGGSAFLLIVDGSGETEVPLTKQGMPRQNDLAHVEKAIRAFNEDAEAHVFLICNLCSIHELVDKLPVRTS